MTHLLTIKDLSKSFDELSVLKNVTLHVEENEFVTILGPSGSGKSTLFHVIGGLLEQDEGTIWLNHEEMTERRGLISYMPQQPTLFPWRTVLNNVLLGQELQGERDEKRAFEMIEKAGLAGYEHAYPSQLSGGMKQRVAFIRALLSPQSLICLDEPFSALDDFTRLEMQQWLLATWATYRKTILFITHSIEEALFLSDRIIVLSANPATVKEEFHIPFQRPRKKSLTLSSEFLQWKRKITKTIVER